MKRVYAFDFLRFVAAILILFCHYEQVMGFYLVDQAFFFNDSFDLGLLVEFFFLLSGFLVVRYMEPIQEGLPFSKFFLKRYVRLLPLLVLSTVCYEVLIVIFKICNTRGYLWMFPLEIDVWGTIITALGIHSGWVFPNPLINNPVWYVSVLILCYIFFFITVKIAKKTNINPVYIFILMIFLGLGIQNYGILLPFFNATTARGLDPFFFGVLLGMYLKDRDSKKGELFTALLICFIFTLCAVFSLSSMDSGLEYILTFLFFPSVIVVFNSAFVKKLFSIQIFQILGNISYGIFAIHLDMMLVMYIFICILDLNINVYSHKVMLAFAGICIVVGLILHYLYERPVTKWLEKKLAALKL